MVLNHDQFTHGTGPSADIYTKKIVTHESLLCQYGYIYKKIVTGCYMKHDQITHGTVPNVDIQKKKL